MAVALPLTAIQVVPAPVVAAEQSTVSIPQETEKRARLAAQAIEELINEYRIANGLHPLVTHELYDAKALAWSQQMVADLPTRGYPTGDETDADDSSAFRHSDMEEWGHSGENIVFDNGVLDLNGDNPAPELRGKEPFQDTEADWARAARILFEDWRNSPPHNANMLAPEFQGIGLGLVLGDKGVVWGTTMFFIDSTPVQNANGRRARMTRDPLTVDAVASGEPFYTPSGARELLGVGAVADPTDTKEHEVSRKVDFGEQGIYEVITEYERRTGPDTWEKYVLDKTKNAPQGLDPEVTGTKIKAAPTTTTTSEPVAPEPSASSSTTVTPTAKATTPATSSTASSTATSSPAAPKTASTTQAEPSITETPTTTPNVATSTTRTPVSTTPTGSTVAPKTSETSVAPTGGQGSVEKQTPTEQPTATKTPQAPKPADPKDEGSSKAGIAIGVIVGLLAAIGVAAAALPMVAPDLARQLGIPWA